MNMFFYSFNKDVWKATCIMEDSTLKDDWTLELASKTLKLFKYNIIEMNQPRTYKLGDNCPTWMIENTPRERETMPKLIVIFISGACLLPLLFGVRI